MRSKLPILILFFIIISVIISSVFIVSETEQVIITQFGKPVGEPIMSPGLHFKVPIIQKTHFFDKRFLEWDGYPNQVPTKDKRFIKVDTYARWRISDPLLFFQRVYNERGAQSRLDDILDGETRNAIANHNLVDLIRSENRKAIQGNILDEEGEVKVRLQIIDKGRSDIVNDIVEAARKRTAELGIELLNLQFKRINYVREVEIKIFERMISERKRIADKYRSEGQGEASKILGDKERSLLEIKSEAYKEAEKIKGAADAKATSIYSRAYNKSADSRSFYTFMKTLETYEEIFSEDDLFLLATDGDLLKYLKDKTGS